MHLGVSHTNLEDDPLYGTLKGIAGSDLLARQAIEGAQALTPQPREISGAELALQFFSNMAANASQPGSTVLSSAASAVKPTADEYIRQVEANRKSREATGPLAISLAKALKPDKVTARAPVQVMVDGKPVFMSPDKALGKEAYQKDSSTGTYKSVLVNKNDGKGFVKDFMNNAEIKAAKDAKFEVKDDKTTTRTDGLKVFNIPVETDLTKINEMLGRIVKRDPLGNALMSVDESLLVKDFIVDKETAERKYADKYMEGDRVTYRTDEEAKKVLEEYGVAQSDAEYNDLFALITTDDPDQIGKPVIQAEGYISWFFPRDPSSSLRITAKTPAGSPTPSIVNYRRDEIKKLVDLEIKQMTVENELFPTVEGAMLLLLRNPEATGAWQAKTLPIRNFLSSAFGIPSEDLTQQKLLEALSNQLGPKMRPTGSGSTSDMEFNAYKQAILSLDNPAKTNYLTLYSLYHKTKNNQEELRLRKRLIYEGYSEKYMQKKIKELDQNIYEKFTSFEVDPDSDNATNTANFVQKRDDWFNALPYGSVVLNNQFEMMNGKWEATEQEIYPGQGRFIIKGWGTSND